MKIRLASIIYVVLYIILFITIFLPNSFSLFPLVSFPVIVVASLLNIVLISLSLIFNKHRVLFLAILIPSIYIILNSFAFNPFGSKKGFSILSFNVQFFRKTNSKIRYEPELVRQAIENGADIICFQEFMTSIKNDKSKNIKMRLNDLGYNVVTLDVIPQKRSYNPGMAIASKFPIVNHNNLFINELPSVNQVMYADILIDTDTIRVVNTHLLSSGIHKRGLHNNKGFMEKVAWISNKLSTGSIKRYNEIKIILKNLENCSYPIVLVGDFHFPPTSKNYRYLSNFFKDSFKTSGIGFGNTINIPWAFNRIDYQWYNSKLSCNKFKVDYAFNNSDHFPIRGWYTIN